MSGLGRYPLEPSTDETRRMLEEAARFVVAYLEGLEEAPAVNPDLDPELRARIAEEPPAAGRPFAEILHILERGAKEGFNTSGPGYLAYIPGGGIVAAGIADLLADVMNRYVGIWQPAPAFAEIEWRVVRWLCDLFDLPAEARGILTSGGSMANFSAIVAARKAKLPEDFLNGTLYATDQAHHSVAKAAVLAGFPAESVRIVPHTPALRMDVGALREAIAQDRAAGSRPFCVVASAGTTNTGAIDPIRDIVEVRDGEDLWLHVDGAYGGFFQLTERVRRRFAGIDRADSITLDPHKAMFLPYGTGALLVRDGERLRAAHSVHADYLQDLAGEAEVPSFADHSPELSRDFRGLRVWLPLMLHGVEAFRAALEEKLDLTEMLHERLSAIPELEVPWEPEVTVVTFRLRGDGDESTRALLDRINASRRVFLSSTLIDGRFFIRACIVSHRTHRDRVEEAAEIIGAAVREVAGS